jgi:hypothetical protein
VVYCIRIVERPPAFMEPRRETGMADNLGLVALARIQALEARPRAGEFRKKWLAGRVLGEAGAVAWLLGEFNVAPADTEWFTVEVTSTGYRWRSWTSARGVHPWDPQGGTEATNDLATLAVGWVQRYGWTSPAAVAFGLADVEPEIVAVKWDREHSVMPCPGAPGNPSFEIIAPFNERIILTCRPQATLAEVARAYQEAQRSLRLEAMVPRERTRPMTSPRRVDLAVIGGRICSGEFESWTAAWDAYGDEHEASTENPDPTYKEPHTKGRFRKDVRDSFKQTTGLDLDFQPNRQGGPPIRSLDSLAGRWIDYRAAQDRERSGSDGDE